MMLLYENIRLALASLTANKSRALLTMLGIIIGISSVISIMTIGNSLTNSVEETMQSMGANNIYVSVQRKSTTADEQMNGIVFGAVSNSRDITEEDYITDDMIYDMYDNFEDSIIAVSASESVGSSTVSANNTEVSISVTGTSAGYFKANEMTMLAGDTLSVSDMTESRNIAIVADRLIDDLWGISYEDAIGTEFTTQLNGEEVSYTIVGVYKYEESEQFGMSSSTEVTTSVYIPLTTAQEFNHTSNYQTISLVTTTDADPDTLATQVENYLTGYYRTNDYFTVTAYSMSSMVESLSSMTTTVTLAISVIAGIALLVGGIGVMNIMLVSITERTKEIGTRKALGAPNTAIRQQFIIEAMIICFIGGAIGVVSGIGVGIVGANIMGYPAEPSVLSIFGSLLFSLIIGIFFGYYPANKAAKMNPIDALRYE
ncbi:MAG: ABC transporter permease [Lachnospiraceae bacterium]